MTTIKDVTPWQIRRLRDNAATAGDLEQVESCDLAARTLRRDLRGLRAPRGGRRAVAQCVAAINATEAMQDERKPTAFDAYLAERRESPEFEAEYRAEVERLRK